MSAVEPSSRDAHCFQRALSLPEAVRATLQEQVICNSSVQASFSLRNEWWRIFSGGKLHTEGMIQRSWEGLLGAAPRQVAGLDESGERTKKGQLRDSCDC